MGGQAAIDQHIVQKMQVRSLGAHATRGQIMDLAVKAKEVSNTVGGGEV
jgi:hypothetical protein